MDLNKRDLIDYVMSLYNKEPIIALIIKKYSEAHNMDIKEVVEEYINSIIIDILQKEISFRKETENILKDIIKSDSKNFVLR